MARKQKYRDGTGNRIIRVATEEFFEKGFDRTSMRSIAEKVGCEAGLLYYYYKTKNDLFLAVLENFFAPFKRECSRIAEEAAATPSRALFRFFAYMKSATRSFRQKYSSDLHRTTLWAIREQTLTVIEPYLEQIVETLVSCGAKPRLAPKPMSVFLAHGVGSVILHESADWVDEITDDLRRTVNVVMGLSDEEARKMFESDAPFKDGENKGEANGK
ncbi:MAG: TetR/AcrR family transcriptional regulator [Candidatus Scatosoma sp.]